MIEQFIAMTRRIIADDGFEDYLPTLLLPSRKDIRVLEDVPSDKDIESVVASWVARIAAPEEDFLAAFKTNDTHFKVLARLDGKNSSVICAAEDA